MPAGDTFKSYILMLFHVPDSVKLASRKPELRNNLRLNQIRTFEEAGVSDIISYAHEAANGS